MGKLRLSLMPSYWTDKVDKIYSYPVSHTVAVPHILESVKAIAALVSDLDQGPFRVLIIDSIICKLIPLLASISVMPHLFIIITTTCILYVQRIMPSHSILWKLSSAWSFPVVASYPNASRSWVSTWATWCVWRRNSTWQCWSSTSAWPIQVRMLFPPYFRSTCMRVGALPYIYILTVQLHSPKFTQPRCDVDVRACD